MKRSLTVAIAATAILMQHLGGSASAVLIHPAPGGADAVRSAQILVQKDSSATSFAGVAGTAAEKSYPPGTPVDTSISFP